jgi:diphthamide biosynthesis enzyme Dph1/Dph2-like protein
VIKRAGKRSYTFAVGKINVAKLANFPEIDAFVVVACEVRSWSIATTCKLSDTGILCVHRS